MTSLFLTESDGNESLDSYVIQTHSKTYLLMRWNLAGKGDTMLWIHIIDREPSSSLIASCKVCPKQLVSGNPNSFIIVLFDYPLLDSKWAFTVAFTGTLYWGLSAAQNPLKSTIDIGLQFCTSFPVIKSFLAFVRGIDCHAWYSKISYQHFPENKNYSKFLISIQPKVLCS